MPNSDEQFSIDTNTSLKVKNLKDLIKEKVKHPSIADVSVDRI